MLAAAAMGSVFASPPPSEMLAAIRAVARNNPGEWQLTAFAVSLTEDHVVTHLCRLRLRSLCSRPFLPLTVTGLAERNGQVAHGSLNNKMMVIEFRAFIQYVML